MRSIYFSRLVIAKCSVVIALSVAPANAVESWDSSSGSGRTTSAIQTQPVMTSPTNSPPVVAPRPFIPSRLAPFTAADAHVSQQRQAPAYFGGSSSRASLSQLPRRPAIQPAPPQPVRGQAKPFETIYREPTISPYLNLEREENDAQGAPNYHTFVRPYQQQIETNRLQQRELQRLRGQLQGLSTTIATPQYGQSATPATGTRSRYMDTAQFYGGWRR
jgi:hypothetical protein